MAGAGFKTFTTGEVLLAADVNTYLMQQTVMVFDDATARSTAIAAPSEGMMSYLKDTNLTYRYDGSNWVSDAGATSPLTTKGDIWVYGTSDTRLPVGTDGYTLVADSGETTGLKWAAPAAASFVGCSAEKGSAQSIGNTSLTAITWDVEIFDTNGFHSTSTNTSRFTVPAGYAGKYLFNVYLNWASNNGTDVHLHIAKNGGGKGENFASPDSSPRRSSTGAMLFDLVVGDYLEAYAYQNSGGSVNLNSNNNSAQRCQVDFIYLGA